MTAAQVPYGGLGRAGEFSATGVPQLGGVRWRFGQEQAFEAGAPPDLIENKSSADWLRTVPVVAGGVAVIGDSNRGVVHAVEAATGHSRWQSRPITPLAEEVAEEEGIAASDVVIESYNWDLEYGVLSPATVAGGVAYLAVNECVFGFDVATGRQVWRRRDGEHTPADCCPVVVGDLLVTHTVDAIQAYDRATGELRWRNHGEQGFLLAPAAVDGGLIFLCEGLESNTTQGGVHAFDVRTGREVWAVGSNVAVMDGVSAGRHFLPVHPVAWDGHVWVTAWNEALGAIEVVGLDQRSGTEAWAYQCPHHDRRPSGAVAISASGVLVLPTEGEGLQAIRVADREALWQRRFVGEIGASPAIAAGIVYQTTEDGGLHAVRLDDGTPLWTFATGESINAASYEDDWYFERDLPVAIDDGVLYLRTAAALYALG